MRGKIWVSKHFFIPLNMETKVGIFIFVFFLKYDTHFHQMKWNESTIVILSVHAKVRKQGKSNGRNAHGNSDTIESHHLLKYNRRLW